MALCDNTARKPRFEGMSFAEIREYINTFRTGWENTSSDEESDEEDAQTDGNNSVSQHCFGGACMGSTTSISRTVSPEISQDNDTLYSPAAPVTVDHGATHHLSLKFDEFAQRRNTKSDESSHVGDIGPKITHTKRTAINDSDVTNYRCGKKRARSRKSEYFDFYRLTKAREASDGRMSYQVMWKPTWVAVEDLQGSRALEEARDLTVTEYGISR